MQVWGCQPDQHWSENLGWRGCQSQPPAPKPPLPELCKRPLNRPIVYPDTPRLSPAVPVRLRLVKSEVIPLSLTHGIVSTHHLSYLKMGMLDLQALHSTISKEHTCHSYPGLFR